mmetsp:Transcript_29388/g.113801  ORF Transcript_29388/g.113801 Transcript_29388/m.113801 type:complete len:522 (-) Transcript_29388:340-1905(-)
MKPRRERFHTSSASDSFIFRGGMSPGLAFMGGSALPNVRAIRRSSQRSKIACITNPVPSRFKPKRFVKGLVSIDGQRDKKILGIALPALFTLMVEPMLSAVDTGFIGRLGVSELAGVGIAVALIRSSFALFNFLAASTTPTVAAASDREECSKIIVENMYVSLMLGLLVTILLLTLSPGACSALAGKSSADIVPIAVLYARWRAIAAPALFGGFVLSGALRGLQDTITPLISALASNGLNVVLDYVTIYYLNWGVAGVAIATSISQIANTVILLVAMLKRRIVNFKDLSRLPSMDAVRQVGFGAVLSIRTMSILATFISSSRLAASRGAVALAGYEVARQVWIFQAFVLDALAVAAQSFISGFLAKGNMFEARRYSSRLLQIGLWCGVLLGVLVWASSSSIPSLFVGDPATREMAGAMLRYIAPLQPVCALVFVYDGIFIAARDFTYTAQSIFLAGVGSWIALIYAASLPATSVGAIWMGVNVLMIGRAVALGSRYLSRRGPIPPSSHDDMEEVEAPKAAQ